MAREFWTDREADLHHANVAFGELMLDKLAGLINGLAPRAKSRPTLRWSANLVPRPPAGRRR